MFALLILALSALLQTSGSDPYCENMIYVNNDIRELRKEIKSISTEVQALKGKCKDTSTNISAVAFNAHFSRYNVSVGDSDAFKFDTVVTNIGNGYNSTTGVFTAPTDGLYIFFLSLMNEPGLGWIEGVLSVNGNLQCFTRAEATIRGDSDGFDDGFCSTVTRLSRGHTVFARRYAGGTYVHGKVWTSFGGTLVYADR